MTDTSCLLTRAWKSISFFYLNSFLWDKPTSCLVKMYYNITPRMFTLGQSISLVHIPPVLVGLLCACVCACMCDLCNFITCVDTCIHHHSQDTQRSISQGSLVSPLYSHTCFPPHTCPLPSLISGNH